MQQPPPQELESEFRRQRLELAKGELEVALVFAEFSSKSYSLGKLQRASDARSKAEAVCRRVAVLLSGSGINEPDADHLQSILGEVRGTLTRLPSSVEIPLRIRGVGAA